MEKVFTLAELVKKYGSKAQKESLKKNGNLSGKEFSILIKSVETEWEYYKVEGRGSNRIITCSGKRSKKIERVDRRINNGQGQLVGEFELNSLVVNYLIKNNNNVYPMSANKWLTELGIVDGKITGALYGSRETHLEKLQEEFSEVIKDYNKADNDIEMLDEFLQITMKNLKSSLVSVFNKLRKAKIIIYQIEKWGCTTSNSHRKLKRNEIKEIASIRRTQLTIHGIKGSDLFKTNKKEVKEFKKAFDTQLVEKLNIKYYYDAHLCVLQDSDLGVQEYLDRIHEKGELEFTHRLTDEYACVMTHVYKDIQSNHSLALAKIREINTSNKSDSHRVKCLKILKQYAPMWEMLLLYFKCKRSRNIKPSIER